MEPIIQGTQQQPAVCVGCHGGQGGLTISYANLVNKAAGECAGATNKLDYVVPGMPSQSYLLDKLKGTNVCGSNTRMPLGGNALPTNEIQTITDWICDGAKQ